MVRCKANELRDIDSKDFIVFVGVSGKVCILVELYSRILSIFLECSAYFVTGAIHFYCLVEEAGFYIMFSSRSISVFFFKKRGWLPFFHNVHFADNKESRNHYGMVTLETGQVLSSDYGLYN